MTLWLAVHPSRWRRRRLGGVFTTGARPYRLGRAVVGSISGALSGRLATVGPLAVGPLAAGTVRAALADLPASVALLHPRVVVPVMFTLGVRRQRNVLLPRHLRGP